MRIIIFILPLLSAVLLASCNYEKYPLASDYINALYNIRIPSEINFEYGLLLRNEHTIICELKEQEIQLLLSRQLPGYSQWRNITPDESYGNKDIVVDGFKNKNLFESHRVYNGLNQIIIVNTLDNKVILLNS